VGLPDGIIRRRPPPRCAATGQVDFTPTIVKPLLHRTLVRLNRRSTAQRSGPGRPRAGQAPRRTRTSATVVTLFDRGGAGEEIYFELHAYSEFTRLSVNRNGRGEYAATAGKNADRPVADWTNQRQADSGSGVGSAVVVHFGDCGHGNAVGSVPLRGHGGCRRACEN
jgi:hypothetical protein